MSMKNIVKTPLICGQPTDESHPHLVMKGEVSIKKKQLCRVNLLKHSLIKLYISAYPRYTKRRIYD